MCEVVILIVMPDLTQTEFGALLQVIHPEKQNRINKFRFYRDAQNGLLGDVLARLEICRVTGLSNEELIFSTYEYGKPFLTNNPDIHHNISHSGHYVACAVAYAPVGIDIETIKNVDLKIAERFFAADETSYISNGPQAERFFEIWTKKESRIKMEGKGLSKPLESFSVLDSADAGNIAYREVFRSDEAICHVCLCGGENPSVRVIDTQELLRQSKLLVAGNNNTSLSGGCL